MVTGLVARTQPDGAQVTAFSGVRRTDDGVWASWVIVTDMSWEGYSAWVAGRLGPGFETLSSGPSQLVARKVLDADSYTVTFETPGAPQPGRIRVTVDGRPF